jgi:hypothetical protein
MMQRHPSPPPNEASSGPSARAPVFYGLVALRTLGRTVLSLLRVNPIKLLVFVEIINGVAAAPFLVVDLRVSGSRRIMGDYVNGNAASILGWLATALMAASDRPPRHRKNQRLTRTASCSHSREGRIPGMRASGIHGARIRWLVSASDL